MANFVSSYFFTPQQTKIADETPPIIPEEESFFKHFNEAIHDRNRKVRHLFRDLLPHLEAASKVELDSTHAERWLHAMGELSTRYNEARNNLGTGSRIKSFMLIPSLTQSSHTLDGCYDQLYKGMAQRVAQMFDGHFNDLVDRRMDFDPPNEEKLSHEMRSHRFTWRESVDAAIREATRNIENRQVSKGFVWKLTNRYGVVHHIIGTIHKGTKKMASSEDINAALKLSHERVITEIDLPSMTRVRRLGKIEHLWSKYGTLMDYNIHRDAVKLGAISASFETIENQFDAFNKLNEAHQKQSKSLEEVVDSEGIWGGIGHMFRGAREAIERPHLTAQEIASLENINTTGNEGTHLLDIWQQGDFNRLTTTGRFLGAAGGRAILGDRNVRWIEHGGENGTNLFEDLARPNAPQTTIAVGCLHTINEFNGLVRRAIQSREFTVERY